MSIRWTEKYKIVVSKPLIGGDDSADMGPAFGRKMNGLPSFLTSLSCLRGQDILIPTLVMLSIRDLSILDSLVAAEAG